MTVADKGKPLNPKSQTTTKQSIEMARDRYIQIRLTDDEMAEIKLRAGNITTSTFLRQLALDQPTPQPSPKPTKIVYSADPELVREINRIGININQITRHLNEGQPLSNAILIALLNLQTSLDETVARTMTNDS